MSIPDEADIRVLVGAIGWRLVAIRDGARSTHLVGERGFVTASRSMILDCQTAITGATKAASNTCTLVYICASRPSMLFSSQSAVSRFRRSWSTVS